MMIKMKQMTRWVEVKNLQEEITHKHEGKPVIYLEKFSASGHLFSTFSFLGTNLTQANVSLICEPITTGCITKTRAARTWILQG